MLRKVLHPDLHGFALSQALGQVALVLNSVFLALILHSRGLEPIHLCLFYVEYSLVLLALIYPAMWIINRYGVRIGFLAANLARAVEAVAIVALMLGASNWTAVLIAATFAASTGFILPTRALHVSRVMSPERKGRDISRIDILSQSVNWLTPLTLGVLAAAHGQVWLGVIAGVMAILAIVPAWNSDRLGNGHQPAPRPSWRRRAPWRDLLASFAWNGQSGVGVWVWSIYLAITLPSFRAVGAIATVASVCSFVLMEVTGRWIDRHPRGIQVVLVGSILLSSLVHLGRIGIVLTEPSSAEAPFVVIVVLTIASSLYGIALSVLQPAWKERYYGRAVSGGVDYIASMEMAGVIAHVLLWCGLALLLHFSPESGGPFIAVFAAAGLLVWSCLAIRRGVEAPTASPDPHASAEATPKVTSLV